MLYIPMNDVYEKILIGNELKRFIVINFSQCFKYTKEKLYCKFYDEQNIRKVPESLYIFLATHKEVEEYVKMMESNFFDNCVHRYNTEILNLLIQNCN